MKKIFLECESSYNGSMQHINFCLESAIFTYTEDLLTNHYVTESTKKSLWDKLKEFFTKIILSIKNFGKEIQSKIEYVINEKKIKYTLNNLHKEMKEQQSAGAKSIEIVDYWQMKKIFNKYYKSLTTYAKKFSKVKYTKTWQIEDDLKEFNELYNKCNKELEEASNKKIKVHIKQAINFVEDEIRGKSELLKTLNDTTREFAEIEQIASGLQTRMNILGAEVIPKHVGFIQRMINSISAFIRRWVVKIVMGVVYIFA